MFYLWAKALHIVFVASWFAGLFYLPRIFVNLAAETHPVARARLLLMGRKLYRFTTLLAVPALAFGLYLFLDLGIGKGAGWMHAKLAIVLLTLIYHHICGRLLKAFEQDRNRHGHRWYRYFNELPVFALLGAVLLVVIKPF
jgi:putative membrane protein